MYQRSAQGWAKHLDFLIVDELALQVAFILASLIRLNTWAYSNNPYRVYVFLLIMIDVLVTVGVNTFHDVLRRGYWKEFGITFKHCFLVFSMMAVFMLATQTGAAYSRIVLFLTFFFHIVLGYSTRLLWKLAVRRMGAERKNKRSMLVVLDDEYGESILNRLLKNDTEDYTIAGLVFRENSEHEQLLGVPVVTTLDDVAKYICREWIDDVYIDCPSTDPRIAKLIEDCAQMAVPIHYHVPSMGKVGNKQFAEKIGGTTVLTNTVNTMTPVQAAVKRAVDILGGIVGSLLALLIMLIVGPIIKSKSPGPILYTQTRIGKNGKRFRIYNICVELASLVQKKDMRIGSAVSYI